MLPILVQLVHGGHPVWGDGEGLWAQQVAQVLVLIREGLQVSHALAPLLHHGRHPHADGLLLLQHRLTLILLRGRNGTHITLKAKSATMTHTQRRLWKCEPNSQLKSAHPSAMLLTSMFWLAGSVFSSIQATVRVSHLQNHDCTQTGSVKHSSRVNSKRNVGSRLLIVTKCALLPQRHLYRKVSGVYSLCCASDNFDYFDATKRENSGENSYNTLTN